MVESDLHQALNEGFTIRELAISITHKAGSINEPTAWSYQNAYSMFKIYQNIGGELENEFIDTFDQWRIIREAMGNQEAFILSDATERYSRQHMDELIGLTQAPIKEGRYEEVAQIIGDFWNDFQQSSPIYQKALTDHPEIQPQISAYIAHSAKLAITIVKAFSPSSFDMGNK
jgi:hypothetical protein